MAGRGPLMTASSERKKVGRWGYIIKIKCQHQPFLLSISKGAKNEFPHGLTFYVLKNLYEMLDFLFPDF